MRYLFTNLGTTEQPTLSHLSCVVESELSPGHFRAPSNFLTGSHHLRRVENLLVKAQVLLDTRAPGGSRNQTSTKYRGAHQPLWMRSDEIKTVAFRLLGCSKLSIPITPAPRTERGQLELCPHLVEVNVASDPSYSVDISTRSWSRQQDIVYRIKD